MSGHEINSEEIFDITIIGGGPTGQFAAYYAGLREMKTKVIDSLEVLGGQLSALYPEKYIYDVAGFPKVYAKDLVNNLTEQMMQYNPTVVLGEKVVTVKTEDGLITLTSENGSVHYSKSVVLTAGVGAFMPRKIDNIGLEEMEDKGVHYFVKDKSEFAGKDILIVGAGDSAFDWALNLFDDAKSIKMIHRSDRFRAHEDTVNRVKALDVEMKTFHELKKVHGSDGVEGVTIYDNRTKEEFEIKCNSLIMSLGFLTNLGPIKEWGFEIVGHSVRVNSRMETNIPGIYGAGDIVDYPGKLKLIALGFGEAAIAVNHAKAYVDPSSKVNPGHSSDSVPKKAE